MINMAYILNELIVKDLTTSPPEEHQYVILFQGRMFILSRDSDLGPVKDVLKNHPHIATAMEQDSVDDFVSAAAEAAPDIMVGEWYPEHKGLVVWDQQELVPQTSLNAKKAARQLGAEKVTYRYFDYVKRDDTLDKDLPVKKATGEIPKIMFHGTTSDDLKGILQFGLDPGRGPSKFAHRGVKHSDHIFLGATLEGALFYADHATRMAMKKKSYPESYPIIIELEVPDLNLLAPDFDADVSVSEDPYYKFRADPPKYNTAMKGMGVSRETGKWGYKGRIPAKFIRWVYYYNTSQDKWHKSRPDTWRKILVSKGYDWETIGYKLGMADYIKPVPDYKNSQYWDQ